jgi:hypothetical protein
VPYAYLAMKGRDGRLTVPSFRLQGGLNLYPWLEDVREKPGPLGSGTLVRHYGFKLTNLTRRLSPGPGNLYHLFHYMLFDTLLPFRVIDLRPGHSFKDELVTGSRNRLMKLARGASEDIEEEDSSESSGNILRHHMPMEMVSPGGEKPPSIGIEYWVVTNMKKAGKDKPLTIRPKSNQMFLNPNHPIIGTLNGQNQGELTGRLFTDLQLPMVARHMVVHIDTTLPIARFAETS